MREDLFGSKGGPSARASFSSSSGVPSVEAEPKPRMQIPFLLHIRWLFFLAIALQVLAWFVPGAGFLFIPVLVLYAAWVIFTLKREPTGGFLKQIRELATRATEEAKKAQSFPQKRNHEN